MLHRKDVVFSKPSIFQPGIADYVESLSNAHPEEISRLRAETLESCPAWAGIMSSPMQASFLNVLVTVSNAWRVLEIGTFTGYSTLAMAAALPADGELITIDNYEADENARVVAKAAFARSSHGGKIHPLEGRAIDVLATVDGPFDLIFVDADKPSYLAYFSYILDHGLLAHNGLMIVDNTLWGGKILDADRPAKQLDNAVPSNEWVDQMLSSWAPHVVKFNATVAADKRVDSVILTVHDGMTLIRHALDGPGRRGVVKVAATKCHP